VDAVVDRLKARGLDALVLAFAVASLTEVALTQHVAHRPFVLFTALGWSLPFALRARFPFWAPVAVCAAAALTALVAGGAIDDLTTPFLAALAAAVSFGSLPERRRAVAGWSALIATLALVEYRTGSAVSDFFWTLLILTLAWCFGVAVGTRAEQTRELRIRAETAEREQVLAAARASAEERALIARELHDLVAHSVSVMVVQASGVRRLLKDDQQREREALLSVEQVGRQALTEMRRMVGVMRTADQQPAALTPQPGLAHLDRLIAQVEEAGLPVTVRFEGARPDLPPGVDLSAYRIIQEGLTNALKHSRGGSAEVMVRYADSSVQLEILDDGPELRATDGNGHGLVGMRERVALYGGTLEAGPRDGGGFALRAELPVEACT
jgi:signal transduction histidine kinase